MPPEGTHSAGEPTVAALVSIGRHPASGRARRAGQDARALEMALGVAAAIVVHAGAVDADGEAALRGYLGMGIDALDLLDQPAIADAVPALAEHLRRRGVGLVFTGSRAEVGESSGLLPYLLAERLGWPVVAGVAAVESLAADSVTLLQALPRGQRRRVSVRLPCVIGVDDAAPAPRQSAFAAARRGRIERIPVADPVLDDAASDWETAPARKRPRRLKLVRASSARERFRAAAAKAESAGGRVLTDVSPEQGAEAIYQLLREEGVLRR